MPTDPLYLIGAGGHCLVVLDTLLCGGAERSSVVVLDDNLQRKGADILGGPVSPFDLDRLAGARVHVSIGSNVARAAVFARLDQAGARFEAIIHPAATAAPSATIGAGSFIAAGAIVAPMARCGRGAIVNHGAIIDHESVIGDFVHVAPGVTLAGRVRVGDRCLIGAGANLLPGIEVGDDVTIGAGAVAIANLPTAGTYAGVPAKRISQD